MIRCLRDIWTVSRYELLDAVRGKRFAVVLFIYMAGAMAACNACISVLFKLEKQISETLGLSASASPGAVTDALMKSESFRRMVIHLVKDRDVALELLSVPPIALIYAGLAFTFTPMLIMLSAPGRIADEVSSGSARFSLVRTTRGAWCVGKFLGQALEIILPLILSAVGAWAIARLRVPDMADASVALAMIGYGWKVWIYCLAFIGLALGVSQVSRSVNQAIAFGLMVWAGLTVMKHVAIHFAGEGWREALNMIPLLLPSGHQLDLWHSDLSHVLPATVYIITIAMVYFSVGHFFFRRRNL